VQEFFNCLFDENEYTCFAVEPKGTEVYLAHAAIDEKEAYFSINPLNGKIDTCPTESWHHPEKPRRCDGNVVVYRNILLEMDSTPLEQQREYMQKIQLPYSTCVFSGSKSYHFIISLETPLMSRSEYDSLVRRVYKAVGNKKLDPTCKNPSRLSRIPGHHRKDTGKIQELIRIQGRVANQELENWLLKNGVSPQEEIWEDLSRFRGPKKDFTSLLPPTKLFLTEGKLVQRGEWNIRLFKAAADLCRNGWTLEEGRAELLKVTGYLDRNDEKTILSAYKNEETHGKTS